MITENIYIPLLDEGIEVSRPTQGLPKGGGKYLVLPTRGYSTELETWKFLPGTIVACMEKERDGEIIKVAVQVV